MSLLTSRLISKESHQPPKGDCEVFWQFDKCTLLSSQGSDAPAIQPLGFLFRATSLSYSSCSACQIGAFRLKSKRPTMASHEENSCPADRLSPSRGNLYSLCSALCRVKSRRAGRACRAPAHGGSRWSAPCGAAAGGSSAGGSGGRLAGCDVGFD